MMIKVNFFTLLFSLFISNQIVLGQEMTMPDKFENLRLTGENNIGNTVRTYDGRYEGIKGHPYLSEDWLTGNVLLENEQEYQQVKLKYNVYEDKLLGLQQKKFVIILDKNKVRAFTLKVDKNDQTLNFVKAQHLDHSLKRVDGNHYVQVLYEGKVSLYAVNKKVLKKANYRGAYNYGNKFDEFVDTESDYYLAESGEVKKLKLKKRKLVKAFEENPDMLNQFINEHQLELKDEHDLLRLISYYEKISY